MKEPRDTMSRAAPNRSSRSGSPLAPRHGVRALGSLRWMDSPVQERHDRGSSEAPAFTDPFKEPHRHHGRKDDVLYRDRRSALGFNASAGWTAFRD